MSTFSLPDALFSHSDLISKILSAIQKIIVISIEQFRCVNYVENMYNINEMKFPQRYINK